MAERMSLFSYASLVEVLEHADLARLHLLAQLVFQLSGLFGLFLHESEP